MRSKTKLVLLIPGALASVGVLIIVGVLFFIGGIVSTPRDFSSPPTIIRLVDENGSPLTGIEVGRNWYDSDCNKEGSENVVTDQSGVAEFSKVPANVGLFTGVWRKAYGILSMCGAGSGTFTTIYVRYHGLCTIVPKGKPLQKVGQSNQDPNGAWFHTSTDSRSNTIANLSFPQTMRTIDYALFSKPHDH